MKKKIQLIGATIEEDKQQTREELLLPVKRIVNEFLRTKLENIQEIRKVKIKEMKEGLEKMMIIREINDTIIKKMLAANTQKVNKRKNL